MSERRRLPNRRGGVTLTINGEDGFPATLITGEYKGGAVGEIFISYSREGAFAKDVLAALAKMTSLALQHGATLSDVVKTMKTCPMLPDLVVEVAEALEQTYLQPKCSCGEDCL